MAFGDPARWVLWPITNFPFAGRDRAPYFRLRVRRVGVVSLGLAALRCAHRKGDRWERSPDPRAHRQSRARLFDRGDEVTVQASEEGSGFCSSQGNRFESALVWTNRAGRAAAGRSRASRWTFTKRAKSSLRCCRPDRKPTLLRESSNHIRGTFAYELLNMRYAIGEMDQGEREGQTAILSEARALTLMVSDSFARDAGANRILLH